VSVTIAEGGLGSRGAALGQTTINLSTRSTTIRIAPGQSPYERSVTLYHVIIEATALQAKPTPPMVLDLSETEFDMLAYMAQEQFGPATVVNLNKLLAILGF